ncbi:hypothetical protein EES43_24770 [Streptomyces sp. ADI96-02]|uniref:hypothetical protein n=1 Tax=Streptomyces sp. ADI96-02 TaxID=1522760 RepID=UPI000F550E7B|nr:hypothetical protein [Streptomyces sp. ADI96-02]RPK56260.1 hypothetical protein EES43_24770 [Streptomyces sp. ADI96-02]
MSADVTTTEYLYGIDTSVHDDARFYQRPHAVAFPVVKKTPKRVYYEINGRTRFVDRQRLEADGKVQRVGGWWESDLTVYLSEPVVEQPKPASLAELKRAMADAHPDRESGSHEAFIAARARYEQARAAA